MPHYNHPFLFPTFLFPRTQQCRRLLQRIVSTISKAICLAIILKVSWLEKWPSSLAQGNTRILLLLLGIHIFLICSQGIGKCTAELFAREGALVTVTDLDAGKHVCLKKLLTHEINRVM